MSSTPQLKGDVQFTTVTAGVIDDDDYVSFKNEIAKAVFKRVFDTVTRPATFGTGTKTTSAGAGDFTFEFDFLHDEADSVGLHDFLWDNAGKDVAVRAAYREGAVSATNPSFEGIISVVGLDTGGTVGEWKAQSQTYPARNVVKGVAAWT